MAYVVGDIGACHDGELTWMLQAVDEAAGIGLDAIKFQWVRDPVAMAKRRGRAYADGYADVYRRYLAWPAEWHEQLVARCTLRHVDYMCTVFVPDDVALVEPWVRHFKVASFEASDPELLGAYRPYIGRPSDRMLIVSLGMGQHEVAYDVLGHDNAPWVAYMLCTSSYPAPVESLGLRALRGADEALPISGFSDHSDPALTWTGALAVAAGAEIVEAHLRLDSTDAANPDYPHAMTPRQFAEYVTHVRFAEACLGDGTRRLYECEHKMAEYRVRGR